MVEQGQHRLVQGETSCSVVVVCIVEAEERVPERQVPIGFKTFELTRSARVLSRRVVSTQVEGSIRTIRVSNGSRDGRAQKVPVEGVSSSERGSGQRLSVDTSVADEADFVVLTELGDEVGARCTATTISHDNDLVKVVRGLGKVKVRSTARVPVEALSVA